MSVAKVILGIQYAVSLIQAGITTTQAVIGAVQTGRAAVRSLDGEELSVEQLEQAIEETKALAAQVGDEAAARIESRD